MLLNRTGYISIKTRRTLKMITDIAELEMLWSAAYIAMVIGSTADLRQQITDRIPQIRNGIIFLAIGAVAWMITYKTQQYLKNRKVVNVAREKLKEARKRAGMTQRQVAEYLGIHERYYQHIEAGQRTGDFTLWDMLEDLFNVHQRKLREISENHPGKAVRQEKL